MKILKDAKNLPKEATHKPCLPKSDTYQHFDNFAVRSLGGAYSAPPRGVTRDHLSVAKQRLLKMDVVLVLEEMKKHQPQLQAKFGWDVADATKHSDTPVYARHSCSAKDTLLTVSEQEFFKEVNKLDYELYAFAQDLAANLTSKATEALRM